MQQRHQRCVTHRRMDWKRPKAKNLTKLSRRGQCTFATMTSSCPNPPHQNELDKCQISLSVAWKMLPVHYSLHPSGLHSSSPIFPCSQMEPPRHGLSMTIEQKFYNPLGTLASKVTHAVLCVDSVFAVLLLTGQDETQAMTEPHGKGGLHSRTFTGSRCPPLHSCKADSSQQEIIFVLKLLSYGSCLSASILTKEDS